MGDRAFTETASGDDLARIGVDLLARFAFPPGRRFRLAGIGVSNFDGQDDQPAAAVEVGGVSNQRLRDGGNRGGGEGEEAEL